MAQFQQSDHSVAEAAIADGKVLVLLLAGGPIALTALAPFHAAYIRGTEPDGSTTTVFPECLEGWSLAPNSEYALSPGLGETPAPEDVPPADAAYMAEWQAAFMALRAAADKSEDPDVAAAVANLEAIEVLAEQGASS